MAYELVVRWQSQGKDSTFGTFDKKEDAVKGLLATITNGALSGKIREYIPQLEKIEVVTND